MIPHFINDKYIYQKFKIRLSKGDSPTLIIIDDKYHSDNLL